MKAVKIFAVAMVALVATSSVKAQEFKASADIVSSYVWRGTQFAGASVQPTVDFTAGGFSIGAWGSTSFDGMMQEADLYAKYAFGFGLTLGVTDYYYPGTEYFNYKKGGSHGFELNAAYTLSGFTLAGNYILNEGAGTKGGDTYFELGYAYKNFSVFAGAGDGWHNTVDDKFTFVNVGVSATKELKLTDSFSLPIKASLIMNPKTEQVFIVAGITL